MTTVVGLQIAEHIINMLRDKNNIENINLDRQMI